MQAVAGNFHIIFGLFIDIVYEKLVIFTINLIIQHWKSDKFEMGTDLVQSAGPRGGLDKAYLAEFRVGT